MSLKHAAGRIQEVLESLEARKGSQYARTAAHLAGWRVLMRHVQCPEADKMAMSIVFSAVLADLSTCWDVKADDDIIRNAETLESFMEVPR